MGSIEILKKEFLLKVKAYVCERPKMKKMVKYLLSKNTRVLNYFLAVGKEFGAEGGHYHPYFNKRAQRVYGYLNGDLK